MPKHGESKYLGQRCGSLVAVKTGYEYCRTPVRPGQRRNTNSFLICRCDCGRSQRVPLWSFRKGSWQRCEWCELVAGDGDAGRRAFIECGQRIEARERERLARVRPYRRPADPDLFERGRWMQ